jgi:putative oxidoreductase
MKILKSIVVLFMILLTISCVQKTYKRTVVFQLDVKGIKDIKTVGLRGNNPLNWNSDYEMTLGKDSVYEAIISGESGYLSTQVKFTINGEFELKDKNNREVFFDGEKDTTFYNAKFDDLKD